MDYFYPPFPPRPASNRIGKFQVGISPVGTIPLVWQDTFLSQYADSPRLVEIIARFANCMNQARNFDAFFDNIWNIDTAIGAGLDLWGRILGVSRVLSVDFGLYFGFIEALPGSYGFNQQPFYHGPPATGNYRLSDDAYRLLLLAKAAFNICDGSIPAINRLLMALFPGRGNAFVLEGSNVPLTFFGFEEMGGVEVEGFNQEPFYAGQPFTPMSLQYVFDFVLNPVETAIVTQSGVLPTPCGVEVFITINP